MAKTIKMRMTAVYEYEAEIENYDGETNPAVMAEIDAEGFREMGIDSIDGLVISVTPISEITP